MTRSWIAVSLIAALAAPMASPVDAAPATQPAAKPKRAKRRPVKQEPAKPPVADEVEADDDVGGVEGGVVGGVIGGDLGGPPPPPPPSRRPLALGNVAPEPPPPPSAPARLELAAAPATGIDADVDALLGDAEAAVHAPRTPGSLDRAIDLALTVELSPDPFSRAQRERVRDRTRAVLLDAGQAAAHDGDLATAARALDARWTLGDRGRDPLYAEILTRWAQQRTNADKGEALYLARRARHADPANRTAADLDHDLTRNHVAPLGYAMMALSAVVTGVGLWALHTASSAEDEASGSLHTRGEVDDILARRDRDHKIGLAGVIGGPVLFLGASYVIYFGNPKHRPVSPRELPALPEGGR